MACRALLPGMTIVDRSHAGKRHKADIPAPCVPIRTVGYTYHITKQFRSSVGANSPKQPLYLIYLISYNYNTIHRFYHLHHLVWKQYLHALSSLLKVWPSQICGRGSGGSFIRDVWLLEIVAALLLHPLPKSILSMITRTQKCRGLPMPFVVSTLALCQYFSLLNYSRRNALDCWSLDISRVGNPRRRIPRSS
jgi:hypothetical protein